mmetsp:Transcript_4277/g.9025  ORF Transcript_4277/g.9025 Transcript_4277/m.9025 type:complete len:245 (-) Transcript_4277:367-1101(-)
MSLQWNQYLAHVRPIQFISQFPVVMPCPHARNDQNLLGPVLLQSNSLCLLHEHGTESLVLELVRVSSCYWNSSPIDMKLSHHGAVAAQDFRSVRCRGQLPQPQQPNQNVPCGVLIRKERLPPPVCHVIPPHQLRILRVNTVVYTLHPHLPCPDIPARQVQVPHPLQGQLPEVAVLDATADEGHGYVALDAVHARPGWDHAEDRGGELDQLLRCIVAIPASLPQLVQSGAADNEGGVKLEPIGPE